MAVQTVIGAGASEWVWAAIAAGDVTAVRAAPTSFDICGIHVRYGSVLTAFLQGLLNLEGRFVVGDACRPRIARELVEELGRRGARPDAVISCANIEVKGLYRSWRLTGDITPLQALIQIRNDLAQVKFESDPPSAAEDEAGAEGDAGLLSELIDRYAYLAATSGTSSQGRVRVPDVVVQLWERCLADGAAEDADLSLVSPDGERTGAHSVVLARASPVVCAMLSSGIGCSAPGAYSKQDSPDSPMVCGLTPERGVRGRWREVAVTEPARVVRLFLTLVYTGCLPAEPGRGESQELELKPGVGVVVAVAFMSNSAKSTLLPAGLGGEVHSLDAAGDALIRFDGYPTRQWVTRKNFTRLRLAATPEDSVRLQKDLARALALTLCWQVPGLVEVLSARLERDLSAQTLEATLEVACLHSIAQLSAACLAFAQSSSQVRAAYDAGSFCPTVTEALHGVFGGGARKRRREPL
mmetsp:Transcript_2148/g.5285  ORF Transcript_2148/g.5285 Transcript_2148/m.5285 type:complete len:468 (+) Transcript_2148:68-1471(+)